MNRDKAIAVWGLRAILLTQMVFAFLKATNKGLFEGNAPFGAVVAAAATIEFVFTLIGTIVCLLPARLLLNRAQRAASTGQQAWVYLFTVIPPFVALALGVFNEAVPLDRDSWGRHPWFYPFIRDVNQDWLLILLPSVSTIILMTWFVWKGKRLKALLLLMLVPLIVTASRLTGRNWSVEVGYIGHEITFINDRGERLEGVELRGDFLAGELPDLLIEHDIVSDKNGIMRFHTDKATVGGFTWDLFGFIPMGQHQLPQSRYDIWAKDHELYAISAWDLHPVKLPAGLPSVPYQSENGQQMIPLLKREIMMKWQPYEE